MKIITAFWGNKYSEKDVKSLPVDLVFSDRNISGVKTLPIDMSYPNTWKKMTLFNSKLNLEDCLFLDIDLIIMKDLSELISYYYANKVKNKPMVARVHWFDNEKMKLDKSTYLSCNVNSGVIAFNNQECHHIYEELVRYRHILPMLFEGTDKWWYHKHKDWYTFFSPEMIQHRYYKFEEYDASDAIIISENSREKWNQLI